MILLDLDLIQALILVKYLLRCDHLLNNKETLDFNSKDKKVWKERSDLISN